MPPWGWALLGAGGTTLLLLIAWFLLHRRGDSTDRTALAESAATRARAEAAAERVRADKLAKTRAELEAELRAVAARKRARLEAIDDKRKVDARNLADDPDALLARVDEILGGTKED